MGLYHRGLTAKASLHLLLSLSLELLAHLKTLSPPLCQQFCQVLLEVCCSAPAVPMDVKMLWADCCLRFFMVLGAWQFTFNTIRLRGSFKHSKSAMQKAKQGGKGVKPPGTWKFSV